MERREYRCKDPKDIKVARLVEEAKAAPAEFTGLTDRGSEARAALCARFPVIRSCREKAANFATVRRRMSDAAFISGSWRGCTGCLTMSIEDMLERGCSVYGRNYVLPECAIGVHDVVSPNFRDGNGNPLTPKQMEENRKKGRRIIGFNANSSATAKAKAAMACLSLKVRCILEVGGCTIVDNWPDYETDHARLAAANCGFSWS